MIASQQLLTESNKQFCQPLKTEKTENFESQENFVHL